MASSAGTGWTIPTLADVLEARRIIAPHLPRTPLRGYPSLDELVGTETFVKHENHLPTGAFKVRGGVNLVAHLTPDERARGLVTASTGNHGQSIGFGGRLFGARVIACVPERANPVKVRAMLGLGVEVVEHGRDFDEARERCEALAEAHGYRYVHSGNEPWLIAGVGTATLEALEEERLDVLVVPIGGGSGAAGACVVAKAVAPGCRVIGVQSERAPAAYRSWATRTIVEDRMLAEAEGLATRVGFELPQTILWEHLDDFVLVGEDELRDAMRLMIEHTRNLVELAGAASLAAALRLRERLAGKRVALVCSGGNATPEQLRAVLA